MSVDPIIKKALELCSVEWLDRAEEHRLWFGDAGFEDYLRDGLGWRRVNQLPDFAAHAYMKSVWADKLAEERIEVSFCGNDGYSAWRYQISNSSSIANRIDNTTASTRLEALALAIIEVFGKESE